MFFPFPHSDASLNPFHVSESKLSTESFIIDDDLKNLVEGSLFPSNDPKTPHLSQQSAMQESVCNHSETAKSLMGPRVSTNTNKSNKTALRSFCQLLLRLPELDNN